ncbi:cytochrome P450 4c21-like [Onthophagus taurus]|uniref:cytochrome P450 4c21-like n=1 Tax=Onthophagus taurus TaxID=166361 RepID=UPI0039BDC93B
MFWVLLTILIFVVTLYYFYQVNKYKIIDDYPGPSALELFKFNLLPKSTVDSYNYFVSLNKKYGPVVKIWLKPFKPTLLVSDGKFIKSILLSKEHVHKPRYYSLSEGFIGNGLPIMTDINLWREERKIFGHVFNNQFIIDYISTFKRHARKLSESINENLNQPIDLQILLLRYGLNIVYDLLLNEDISKQDDRVNRYMESVKIFLELHFDRIHSPLKINDTIYKLTNNYKSWTKCCDEAREFVESTLKKVIKLKKESPNKSDRKDFIDLLLESNLSYERILAQLRTLVIAGSDTVSSLTSFALYELANHPELQEKIYQEYIAILGVDKNVFAEFRDIQQMTFTECVTKETLRLFPPGPFIFRTLINPTEIGGKIFPGNIDILFSIIDSHYSNFDNPTEFIPERFLPENAVKIPANAYLPFSLGPRDCIGKTVGIVETKFLLSYIIRHFTLHPISNHEKELAGEIILTSKNGLPIIFKKRID